MLDSWPRAIQIQNLHCMETIVLNHTRISYLNTLNKVNIFFSKKKPAMMCDQLQKDYPNTFSLKGETVIKEHIGSLFNTSKKVDKDKNDNDKRDTTSHASKNTEWKSVVNDIVNENLVDGLEYIY